MSRPETIAPPEIFYNDKEAKKYTQNSHIIEVQSRLSQRAYELLALEEGKSLHILDIGCGSGLSGEILTESGHYWTGMDISDSMLQIAKEREVEGDLILQDMGDGFSFRVGTFDGAISISAVQWLMNADKKSHHPQKRLAKFFFSLYKCLKKGARAVFQLYAESSKQLDVITNCALKAGFSGGVVVDFPHSTRAKKYYLCLFAGIPNNQVRLPKGLEEESEEQNEIKNEGRKKVRTNLKKEFILGKKDIQAKQGKDVKQTSKYSGRKRKIYF
jgi:18S rRNA (guanine1575-N7)-methyltransferase